MPNGPSRLARRVFQERGAGTGSSGASAAAGGARCTFRQPNTRPNLPASVRHDWVGTPVVFETWSSLAVHITPSVHLLPSSWQAVHIIAIGLYT